MQKTTTTTTTTTTKTKNGGQRKKREIEAVCGGVQFIGLTATYRSRSPCSQPIIAHQAHATWLPQAVQQTILSQTTAS